MTETEQRYDFEVPKRADADGLVESFRNNHVTFRSHSSGFDVYLDGKENTDVYETAVRHGYTVTSVSVAEGDHSVKLALGTKRNVRYSEDRKERDHRISDD